MQFKEGRLGGIAVLVAMAIAVSAIIIHAEFIETDDDRIKRTSLLITDETVLEQSFSIPQNATVDVQFIELLPGAETGWHTHDAPLVATILHGQATLYYCQDENPCDNPSVKKFNAGDSFVEAINISHNGKNEDSIIPVKIHVVLLEHSPEIHIDSNDNS